MVCTVCILETAGSVNDLFASAHRTKPKMQQRWIPKDDDVLPLLQWCLYYRMLRYPSRSLSSIMTRSTDQIVEKLFARSRLPPLEPGTNVYDPSLTSDIKRLKEDKFVVAGE